MSLIPDFAMVYNNLGNLLIADSNRWDEAETLIRESLEHAHDDEKPFCYASLGELLAQQGRSNDAKVAYQSALAGFSEAGYTDRVERISDALQSLETN